MGQSDRPIGCSFHVEGIKTIIVIVLIIPNVTDVLKLSRPGILRHFV
jgi:hypothetical protein